MKEQEKDVVVFQPVNQRFNSWVKKIWQRGFLDHEILWWLAIVALLIWGMFSSLKYLPIILPNTFSDQNLEISYKKLGNLTVFYPPRVLPGQEYKLDFVFQIPSNLPKDAEKIVFQLSPKWPGSPIEPTVIEFPEDQTGLVVKAVTLRMQSANPPPNVEVTINSPELNSSEVLTIPIVERSYSLALFVTFLITFGATIFKVLLPMFSRIGQIIKKRLGSAPAKESS